MSARPALDLSFSSLQIFRSGAAFLLLLLIALRAFAGSATLAWDASPDTAVTGYKLYYGTASGSYPNSIDVGGVTTYTVLNLTEGRTYYYALKAHDSKGTESAFSNEVSGTIPAAAPTTGPVSNFTANATTGPAPLTVAFTSTPTGQVTGYSWSFGDGTSSTSPNPSKTYTTAGKYTVSLTVTGPTGTNTATKTGLITVTVPAPVATFTASTSSGTAPLSVQFTNTSTGTITSHAWNFGNGTTSTAQTPPPVTYLAAGSYPVTLTETGPGGSNTRTATITVSPAGSTTSTNQAPSGRIRLPSASVVITEGQSVAFSGTGTDPDGNIPLSYAWDFGGGAPASSSRSPTVAFAKAGTYTASLTVRDAKGMPDPTPAILTVTVTPKANQAPNSTITASATAITQGQSVSFQGSGTDPDGDTPLTYAWDFGSAAPASSIQNPTVTFAATGTYIVKLTVIDANRLADPTPATVTITVTPPTTTTTPAPAPTATVQTLWPATARPVVAVAPDTAAVNLGVKFKSDVSGYITGIRFYKGAGNTGTHVGAIWTSSGQRLATVTFTNETASGWQQANFATPVPISANTVYVASYIAPNGRYAGDNNYFANGGVDSGSLHALSNGVTGGNGVYAYAASTAFPNSTYKATNYWVDVVFKAGN